MIHSRLFELFVKYRVAPPLCAFLLFLNTANAILGGISAKTFFCGLSLLVLSLITYFYDARFRSREDDINRPEGRGSGQNGWYLLAAALVPVVLLVSAGLWVPLLYAAVAMFLYSDPGIFPRRLKTIPGIKMLVNVTNFWVAGVLAAALLKYEFSGELAFSLLRSTVPVLVFIFCITVLLDIRDVTGDREAGVSTLPVMIGVRASAWLLIILLAASGTSAFARGQTGVAVFSLGLALFPFFAIKPKSRLYYEGALAFINVFLGAALVYRLY